MWSMVESGLGEGDMTIGHAHLVNETLYSSMCRGRTLAFDLARETFEFFPPLSVNHLLGDALCVMGGCLSKCSSNSQNDLIIEIVKRPPRVSSVVFSCDLMIEDPKELKYCKQLFGFTKTGKVFYTREKPGMLGLLDQCSKRTLATFDDQVFIIESYVPTQSSPHPAAELPNEPPEGTWPVYQPEILPD
ncbi:uncharacterized protein LOC110696205 [Chenopodium quinoa]|uniref:uncharacterized protein LOC110696205 n=1 Tax=Chenopodium quinoa TaxID=63459 RepID=UPI000B790B99|nr:uncharacterized protein LOC110696205 [Chenopodium quinoa]XP_021729182.1 uncharacterized protein LOC110696205 [Chenopodium quinoa]